MSFYVSDRQLDSYVLSYQLLYEILGTKEILGRLSTLISLLFSDNAYHVTLNLYTLLIGLDKISITPSSNYPDALVHCCAVRLISTCNDTHVPPYNNNIHTYIHTYPVTTPYSIQSSHLAKYIPKHSHCNHDQCQPRGDLSDEASFLLALERPRSALLTRQKINIRISSNHGR